MEEQVVCNQCERKFAKESSLRQHERDKHKIEQCKECGKKFERKKALKKHFWFVHKNKRRKKVTIRRISNDLRLLLEKKEKTPQEKRSLIKVRPIHEQPYLDLTGEIGKTETEEEKIQRLREERELGK